MKKSHLSESLIEDLLKLLINEFGAKKVQSVFSKLIGEEPYTKSTSNSTTTKIQFENPPISIALENLKKLDKARHNILSNFYSQLKGRAILPESQDIRYFAGIIGLKEISGKSRKDMVPKLMRFLLDQPIGNLRHQIEAASTVSEQQRQQGFSFITDKLLRER